MARKSSAGYRCGECGYETAKWVGRCPECHAWGSVTERGEARPAIASVVAGVPSSSALPIAEVDLESARAVPTGVGEFDRVLGGGLVPGAVVLLAGEPGVGKSTLLLEVAHRWATAADSGAALYVTAEESASQVRLRAERTGNVADETYLAAESDLGALVTHVDEVDPGVLIVDSVQTLSSAQVEGSPGGVTQVRSVTSALVGLAKERGFPVILVGHVTKEGSVAGPRLLEHLVDVVLQFEGEKHSTLRLVRGVKNRFGAADEIGCFELVDDGIVDVVDPSGLFVNAGREPVPGTAITVTVEGKRPLLCEVQALVSDSTLAQPRRAVSGLDSARVSMVLAVLERRLRVPFGSKDVYTATVGGMKVTEPAVDLAAALAVASATQEATLSSKLVAIGEIGLAGEVRRVTGVRRRLAEAARLGFTHALVPPDAGESPEGIKTLEVDSLAEALHAMRFVQ